MAELQPYLKELVTTAQ